MNFSKTTSYSLHVLSYMAKHESVRMSANYLHNQLDIPYSYLRAMLSELSKNSFIKSIKGRDGGYILSRDKSDIFLMEIIETTEGHDSFNRCALGFDKCPFNGGCYLHPVWIKMRTDILKILKTTSLADVINGGKLTE
jgi:Rrf2 family protein